MLIKIKIISFLDVILKNNKGSSLSHEKPKLGETIYKIYDDERDE